MEILIKRLRRKNDTFARIGEKKNELRKGNTLIYKGWTITAEPKYGRNDGRLWITATKEGKDKIKDDLLTAIFNVINDEEK